MELSTLSVTLSPLLTLVFLLIVGGGFGVVATNIAKRFGRSRLVPFWIAVSVGLGSTGATRVLAIERSSGLWRDHVSAPGTFALLITATTIILSVPTFEVWRRTPRNAPIRYGRRAFAAAGWTFLGLVLALIIALVLDLSNIPFVPIH